MNEKTGSKTTEVSVKRLIDLLKITGKNYDLEKINAAYEYAAALHEGQFRVSGDISGSIPMYLCVVEAELCCSSL